MFISVAWHRLDVEKSTDFMDYGALSAYAGNMPTVYDPMRECTICEIIPQIKPELIVMDGDHWVGNLRDNDQTLLGTTFITLKRHAHELDYLTTAEESEFVVIRNGILRATRAAFSPLTFNVSCLKNDAFKTEPDFAPPEAAHVHYHVKPRYGDYELPFAGDTFRDPMPGQYLTTYPRHAVTPDVAAQIAAEIKTYLFL